MARAIDVLSVTKTVRVYGQSDSKRKLSGAATCRIDNFEFSSLAFFEGHVNSFIGHQRVVSFKCDLDNWTLSEILQRRIASAVRFRFDDRDADILVSRVSVDVCARIHEEEFCGRISANATVSVPGLGVFNAYEPDAGDKRMLYLSGDDDLLRSFAIAVSRSGRHTVRVV